mgnify:CR=1 FL=1
MQRSHNYTQQPKEEDYSEIIDVRSPSEFAEDHMPGAINLPVLDDQQRAKVGTIYKQVSSFEARKIGASLVAGNISRHLESHFAAKDKNYHPLVYCWRGGQRSQSLAAVLVQIGWQVTVLDRGYKTYRAYVREQLEQLPQQFTYRVLCGLTGSGKTLILRQLAQRGVQVLDLEELANHRGSLLGQEWEDEPLSQPSQKWFESLLLEKLQHFDVHKPVWVEAESNKIGQIYLPHSVWQNMKDASCVEVELPLARRIEWLLQEYPHLGTNPEFFKTKLECLQSRYGWKKINQWYGMIDEGQGHALVGDLLETHYDPAYRRSISKCYGNVEFTLPIVDLSEQSVHNFVNSLVSLTELCC